ncbi:MAG TPA: hypothetical protein VGR71_08410 [Nitrospira sp.]|nr:hypothetical protein [Nitrospira sp.]
MLPPRIMYIQLGMRGPARIGRVTFSKSGSSVYYKGKMFTTLKGGYKSNFYDVKSGEEYWISGPRKDGADGLYGYRPTPIDDDVREEYWTKIRKQPAKRDQKTT